VRQLATIRPAIRSASQVVSSLLLATQLSEDESQTNVVGRGLWVEPYSLAQSDLRFLPALQMPSSPIAAVASMRQASCSGKLSESTQATVPRIAILVRCLRTKVVTTMPKVSTVRRSGLTPDQFGATCFWEVYSNTNGRLRKRSENSGRLSGSIRILDWLTGI
jgi:hypothetical protein